MRSSAVRYFVPFLALVCCLFLATYSYAASSGVATATTFTLTSSGNTVTALSRGDVLVLTATIKANATALTQGQVRFCDTTSSPCTGAHLIGIAQLTASGTAIFRYQPSVGVHNYKVIFVGTHSYATSTSSSTSLTVTGGQYPSTTSFTTTGTGPYNLSATVTGIGTSATSTPTGSVSFIDTSANNAVLATSTLSAGTSGVGFTPVRSPSLAGGFEPLAVGDFNNDGKQDVVIAAYFGTYPNNQTQLQILSGNGDGTLTPGPVTSTNITSAVIAYTADFNGDGNLDLGLFYSQRTDTGEVAIFLGNGDGTFTAVPQPAITGLPDSTLTYTIADFNGDGIPDLALLDGDANAIDLLIGVGDGTFTKKQGPSGSISQPIASTDFGGSIVSGDFNGDGNADLAILAPPFKYLSTLVAYAGNGDGSFQSAIYSGGNRQDVPNIAVGDFNADGIDEIVYANDLRYAFVGQVLNYNLIVANPLLSTDSGIYTTSTGVGSVQVADFNGDGNLDVLVSGGLVGLGNGTGSFRVVPVPVQTSDPSGFQGYLPGDLNGDGLTDLVDLFSQPIPVVDLAADTYTATATVNPLNLMGSGTHQIEANYSGDSTYNASSYTAGLNAIATTTLTLTAAPSSSTYGQQVALTAILSPYSTAGHSTDGEMISFSTQTNPKLGTAQLMGGAATLNTTSLPIGTSTIQASFAGDGVLQQTSSNSLSYTVYAAPALAFVITPQTYGVPPFAVSATSNSTGAITYSVVSGPATLAGSTLTITGAGGVTVQASQAADAGYVAATKTASFIVAQAPLTITAANSARVFGAPNPSFSGAISGAVNGDRFSEEFTTSAAVSSQIGSYPVTPSAIGAALANYVVHPVSETLTISQAGSATTFTLTGNTFISSVVALTSGAPTGTVNFLSNQTSLGTASLSGGTASLTLNSPPTGAVTLTAQYSGDVDFTQSSSASLPLLALTPASSALTATTTGTVTDVVTVGSPSGYTGTVQLACTGLPANTTCSSTPVTFPTSTPSTTLTITTGATQTSPSTRSSNILAATLCAPTLLLLVFFRKSTRLGSLMLPLLLLVLTTTLFTACGGNGNNSPTGTTPGTPTPNTNATPAGSYTVNVNATGTNAIALTQTITLKVQ